MKMRKKLVTAAIAAALSVSCLSQAAYAANVIIAYQGNTTGPGGSATQSSSVIRPVGETTSPQVNNTQPAAENPTPAANSGTQSAVLYPGQSAVTESGTSVIYPGASSTGTPGVAPAVKNDWRMIDGKWYRYGLEGQLLTGWQDIGGKIYYLSEKDAEGHPYGALYVSEKTPDGRSVDQDGVLDTVGNPDTDYIEKANPYGDQTCVEINLSEQRVYAYQGALLVLSSPVVTGSVNGGHATPPGNFKIYSKQTDRILRGTNDNGTKYASHVDYWMPFNGGIGLHDADWRDTFGGQIYVSGGSHGCVNMPKEKAAKMYNIVYVGMPVHVHN